MATRVFERAREGIAPQAPARALHACATLIDADLQTLDLFPGVVGLVGEIATLAAHGVTIELEPVRRAVAARQAEYAAGRVLACEALARIGIEAQDIGMAANRAPAWPRGAVGSISHSMGRVAVAVAREDCYPSVGLDLEAAASLAKGTNAPLDSLFTAGELNRFQALDLTLIFSAKEALYKLLNPILGRYIDHLEIEIQLEPARGGFCAEANTQADLAGLLQRVRGRYLAFAGCWVTCAALHR